MRILQKLYQAICEDAADQKLQKYNLTNALKDPEETGEYSSASISLDYYHASADWKTYMTGLMIITEIRRIRGNTHNIWWICVYQFWKRLHPYHTDTD